jgi:hypothetical protein
MWHVLLDPSLHQQWHALLLPTQDDNNQIIQQLDHKAAPPDGFAEKAAELIGWLKWGVLAAGVVGLLICAMMIVLGRRNRNQMAFEGLIGGAWVLGGLLIASVAATLVGTVSVTPLHH